MSEFLDKVYGYEYFGIILFAAIAVLILAFIIVLFFGKKDEKKRKLAETQKIETNNVDAFAQTNVAAPVDVAPTQNNVVATEPPTIEAKIPDFNFNTNVEQPAPPVVEKPVIEAKIPDFNFNTNVEQPAPPVAERPVIEAKIPEFNFNPVVEEQPSPKVVEPPVLEAKIPDFNFKTEVPVPPVIEGPVIKPEEEPALNIATQKEEEPKIDIPNFNFDELAASISKELDSIERKERVEKPVDEAPITPIEDVVKPISPEMPKKSEPIFSSVYVNKPAQSASEVQKESSMELPKPAEMPELKKTDDDINMDKTVDLSSIVGESYDIK